MRNKKLFQLAIVLLLTLCLPLTGMGVMGLTCPCTGHQESIQTSSVFEGEGSHHGCCEKAPTPRSAEPCPCGKDFCDFTLEVKNNYLNPFLADSFIFSDSAILKSHQSTEAYSVCEGPPLDSFNFPREDLYLLHHPLRC